MEKKVILDPTNNVIHNDSEMDELTTSMLDQLDESLGSMGMANLHQRLYETSQKNKKYLSQQTVDYYRRKYIDILMEHGWTLKKEDIGSYQMASIAFMKALRINAYNPLAHYRLAHIAANSNNQANEALIHFLEALKQTSQKEESKYKLSAVQVANAEGMAIKLFTEVLGSVSLDTPEIQGQYLISSIQTLRNLVQNVSTQAVIHVHKHEESVIEIALSKDQYYDLLSKLENHSSSLVLDKFIDGGSIGYTKTSKWDPIIMNRLLELLGIDRRSSLDFAPESRNALCQQISRLREKVREVGVDKLKFDIIVPSNGTPYCETSLDIHYFKKIFD